MDKADYSIQGPEFTATPITAKEAVEQALTVFDRKTGEAYDPKARFDEMMQKDEILAMFKRMSIK